MEEAIAIVGIFKCQGWLTYLWIVRELIAKAIPFWEAKLQTLSIRTKLMIAWWSLRPELIET